MTPRPAATRKERLTVSIWRCGIAATLLVGWECYGRLDVDGWFSRPSLIIARIANWSMNDLAAHVATTLGEMAGGLVIGIPLGAMCGLVLGRSPTLAGVVRPIIFGLYSIPLVTLAPLFIFWFGLGMLPKIILVAIVTFFLLFFTTFSGVQTIDRELVESFRLLGASRAEVLLKLIGPACLAWIISGIKLALPYSLIAATVGEMLLARAGLGYLLMAASQQIDMTGMFAALTVLMAIGVVVGQAAAMVERRVLRWRALAP